QHIQETSLQLALHVWADETLKTGRQDDRMSVEDAIAQARAIQRSGDFKTPFATDGDVMDNMRLETIVATAAAVLKLNPHGVEAQQQIDWCRDVLVTAAETPWAEDVTFGQLAAVGVLERAAQGLMILVRL